MVKVAVKNKAATAICQKGLLRSEIIIGESILTNIDNEILNF